MKQIEVDNLCRGVYRETGAQIDIALVREQFNLGFEILMGPPVLNPEFAFIGYQPGDWEMSPEKAREVGYESSWVTEKCQYATADWKLAQRLRGMFTAERLERCVGLNAIFVRARSIAEYRKVPIKVRKSIRSYCLTQVAKMLDSIAPQKIVVMGFETMRLFGPSTPAHVVDGKILVRRGTVNGRDAYATPHLSAAWGLRVIDFDRIAGFLLAQET